MNAGTFNLLLIIIALSLIMWRGLIAAQVMQDARQHGFKPIDIGRWALIALVKADRYWWGARLDRFSVSEARVLLADSAREHDLLNVTDVRCPLCDHEIKQALSVVGGDIVVRRQAVCAGCDFRVDACRHCAHFIPATDSGAIFGREGDFSHGRCGFYRASESVRTAYPQHARRMEALGYDTLPTPRPIVDSFIPLPECTAFTLKLEHLRDSGVPWLDRQRAALIHLQQRINRGR
jgi:hypothetical protein